MDPLDVNAVGPQPPSGGGSEHDRASLGHCGGFLEGIRDRGAVGEPPNGTKGYEQLRMFLVPSKSKVSRDAVMHSCCSMPSVAVVTI